MGDFCPIIICDLSLRPRGSKGDKKRRTKEKNNQCRMTNDYGQMTKLREVLVKKNTINLLKQKIYKSS
jgi:hypothetical protein